jgi:endonuclease/exonuclease/phosphatase (EEP) superfamily protein YafD
MGRTPCLGAASIALALAGLGQASAFWLPLDTLAHFTPQLLIASALLSVAALWPRRRTLKALLSVPIALVLVGIWPFVSSWSSKPAPSGERTLRVMTFNVWARNASPEAAAGAILAADPDVVVLVELLPGLRGVLDRIASRYPHRAVCPKPRCWLAVAAKHPFAVEGRKDLMPQIVARFGPELAGLTVIGLHLARPPAAGLQLQQLAEATAVVSGQGDPIVAVGDFNATPFSVVTQTFAHDAGLRRVTSLPSWPTFLRLPQVSIDHIFVSPGITASGVRLGEPGGSDHYPVIADLILPP